jgi:hypothetical protein
LHGVSRRQNSHDKTSAQEFHHSHNLSPSSLKEIG